MASKTTATVKETTLTMVFRLIWENVTKPRKNEDGTVTNPAKYDITGVSDMPATLAGRDKDAQAAMKKLMEKAIALGVEEGKFTQAMVDQKLINLPWEPGDKWITKNPDKTAAHELYKGKLKFTAKSTAVQPGYGKQTPSGFQKILDPTELYPGCYCIAEITAYAYSFGNQKGVSFGLNNIMKVREGTPIIQQRDPSKAFEGLDPTDFGNDNSSMMEAPTYDDDLGV